jgi:hypothetical protein
MAFVIADRVKETTTTTGTGTLSLAGASSGYRLFVTGIGNGNVTFYTIIHQSLSEWEVGIGTVTDAATDTLSRTTVLASSNSGSLVNFSAGTKDVFCSGPAGKSLYIDNNGNIPTVGRRVVTLADATSITPSSDDADVNTHVNTQATGSFTVNGPAGTPVNGQKLMIRIKSTNVQTFIWNGVFRGSTDISLPTATTGASKTDYFGFVYNGTDSKWDIIAVVAGY